ncbi:UNVERIFIED_ORG: hypothetical protein GGI61_004231 [Rhizobium esperanzae]
MPNAKEAEEALGHALQAKAITEILAENIARIADGGTAGPRELSNLALVAEANAYLLDEVARFIEAVRDVEVTR